jgi:hypothetical protein
MAKNDGDLSDILYNELLFGMLLIPCLLIYLHALPPIAARVWKYPVHFPKEQNEHCYSNNFTQLLYQQG